MDKQITMFNDTETEKQKFHQHKSPILMDKIDINKLQYLIMSLFRKYFLGYKDAKKIRPFRIFLQ